MDSKDFSDVRSGIQCLGTARAPALALLRFAIESSLQFRTFDGGVILANGSIAGFCPARAVLVRQVRRSGVIIAFRPPRHLTGLWFRDRTSPFFSSLLANVAHQETRPSKDRSRVRPHIFCSELDVPSPLEPSRTSHSRVSGRPLGSDHWEDVQHLPDPLYSLHLTKTSTWMAGRL